MFRNRHAFILALAIAPFITVPASAEVLTFNVEMTSANNPSATGMLEATFDTDTLVLSWVVSYTGLTGPAVKSFQELAEIAPEDAVIANWVGVGFYKKENYSEALIWFEKALNLDPNSKLYKENCDNMRRHISSASQDYE